VAAAAELDGLPLPFANTLFVLSAGPDSIPFQLGRAAGTMRPVFDALLDPAPALLGIESAARNDAVGRARSGLLPLADDGFALSDALLVTPDSLDLPASRDEAVASMLGRTTIGAGEVVVYWEVYGFEREQQMEVSVSVVGTRPGLLTRILRALGARAESAAPVVSWMDPASGSSHPMAVAIDIRALEDGVYDLKLEVAGQDGSRAAAERRFEVDRR